MKSFTKGYNGALLEKTTLLRKNIANKTENFFSISEKLEKMTKKTSCSCNRQDEKPFFEGIQNQKQPFLETDFRTKCIKIKIINQHRKYKF